MSYKLSDFTPEQFEEYKNMSIELHKRMKDLMNVTRTDISDQPIEFDELKRLNDAVHEQSNAISDYLDKTFRNFKNDQKESQEFVDRSAFVDESITGDTNVFDE